MDVLGIDPGSNITGWCLIENGRCTAHGVITLDKKLPFSERRHQLRAEVMGLFEALICTKNLVVAIEDPMSRSLGVAKKLAAIKAMIEEKVLDFGWVSIDVTPHEWQAMAREYGGRLPDETIKEMSLRAARDEFGIDTQDAADAAWIALYAAKLVVCGADR